MFKLSQLLLLLVASVSLCLLAPIAAAVDPDTDSSNCPYWAEIGECDKNPGFMLVQCASSCDKAQKAALAAAKELEGIHSFFDLEAKDIHGKTVKFEEFRGKVTIIVNVASYCGYTESHYRGLVQLWNSLKSEPANILAFPCNQFGAQEPGTESEIETFAKGKGAEFRLMSKVDVNGPNAHVVYKYLKKEAGPASIGWNFATYFVVSPDGTITSHSGVEPMGLLQYSLDLLKGDEL